MPRVEIALAAAVTAVLSLNIATAAETREPPACSAIAFRPLSTGLGDGVQNAGLYHSRFGRIEVKSNVKGGQPQGYFVEINGKPPAKVAANDLPKEVAACAKLKRMGTPTSAQEPCTGDRITVLTSHSGDKRYYLLYGHEGRGAEAWHFCSAGTT